MEHDLQWVAGEGERGPEVGKILLRRRRRLGGWGGRFGKGGVQVGAEIRFFIN